MADAHAIAAYLVDDGVRFDVVRRRDCARRFLDAWKVPASADELAVLPLHGNEPIYRIPVDNRRREVSGWEVPARVPPSLAHAVRLIGGTPAIETSGLRAAFRALTGR